MKAKSAMLPGLLLTAMAIGVVWDCFPLSDASERLNRTSSRGPGFVLTDLPLNKLEQQWYTNVSVKKYQLRTKQDTVLMTLVDGSHDRHAVHDPTYCLRGDGWVIQNSTTLQIDDSAEISLIRVARNGVVKEAVFWFSDGDQIFSSMTEYWWRCSLRRMTLGQSGDEPIFVMLQPATDTPVHWRRVLERVPGILNQ